MIKKGLKGFFLLLTGNIFAALAFAEIL